MSAMRAPNPESLDHVEPIETPRVTVRAGGALRVRVGAVDRQSGVVEIVADCRSRENPDLSSTGRWIAGRERRAPGDNYYPVIVPIPPCSPTVVWELHRITLCDGGGNRKSYEAGKDFEGMLFQVLAQPDADCTPPRLLGVRFVAP